MAQSEEIAKLAVSLSLEAQNFDKQMASINKSVKNAERDFKSAGKGVDNFEKSFVGLDAKIQKTSKQLDLYNTKLSKQKEQYTKLQGDLEATKNKLDELEQTQGKNSDAWKEQVQLVQKNAQDLAKLGTDINTTESNISKLTNELNQSQKEFEQLGNKTKSLDENLEDISRQADLTQSEFEKLGSELQTSGNYFSRLGNDMNQLSAQITSGNQKITAYENEIRKLGTTLDKSKQDHSKLGQEINKTEQELNQAKSAYGENSTEVLQLKQKLLQLKDEYNSLESEITQGTNALDRYQTELNQTQTEVNQLANELLNMPFERIGNDLKSSGEAIKGVGQSMTTGVTLPIAAAGAAATKAGVDFDSAMSKLQATSGITDKTSKSFVDLETKAKQMGSSTSFSATEAAEGLTYLALAGWDVETQISRIEPVLRAAEAGGMDLARCADLVTDSMSAAGISSDDFSKYLDITAQTQRKANTSMEQMLEVYTIAGGMFDQLNMPLEQSGALIGVLANRSTKGSEAGNALISVFSNLITETGQAGKALESMGISLYDTNGKQRDMVEVLKEMAQTLGVNADGTSNLTEKQQQQYAAMVGGKTQFDTLMKLLAGVSGEYDELYGQLENSNGALNEMATIMKDNLGGSIDNMKSAIEGALIDAFKAMEPVLETIVGKITDLANWFNSLDEEQQRNIVTIAGVAAAMGPLLMMIGQLIIVGGNATLLFGKLSSGMSLASTGTGGLSAILGGLSGIALPAVAAALVLLIAKLGDNEKAILTLQEKYGGFGTFIGGVMEFISGAVQVTVGYIIELFKGGFDVIGAIIDGPGGNTVKDATARMNENLNLTMEEGMNKLLLTTTRGMSQMRNASDEQLNGTVTSMETIMDAIPNIVDGKYRTAANNLGAQLAQMDFTQISILQGMNDTTKMMFEGIRTGMTVDEASKKVEENLKQMATAGKIDADTMSKDVSSAMEQMKKQMDTKTKEGANSVDTNMDKAASDVNQATSKIQSDVNKNMNTSSTDMKNKSKEGADSISQNYGKGASDANKELSKISSDTKSNMDKSTQAIRQSGSDMYNGVKTSFSKMEQVCKQHATEMYKGVQTSAKKMADSAKTSASDMYRGVTTSTSKMANQAISDWNRIRNAYSKPIKGSVTMTKTTVNKTEKASLEPGTENQAPIPFTSDILRATSIPENYNFRTGYYSIPSQSNNIINNITDTSSKEISKLYDLLSKTLNKDNSSVVVKIENFINNTDTDINTLAEDIAELIKRKTLV